MLYTRVGDTKVYIIESDNIDDLKNIIDKDIYSVPDEVKVIDRVSTLTIKRRIVRKKINCILLNSTRMFLYINGSLNREDGPSYKRNIKNILTSKYYIDNKPRETGYYKITHCDGTTKEYYLKKPNSLYTVYNGKNVYSKAWIMDNDLSTRTISKVLDKYIYDISKVDIIEVNGTNYYSDKTEYSMKLSEDLTIISITIRYYKNKDVLTRLYMCKGNKYFSNVYMNNKFLSTEVVDIIPDFPEDYEYYIKQL